jgi:hypothetical protein
MKNRTLLVLLLLAGMAGKAQTRGHWVNRWPLQCANGDTAQFWRFDCDTVVKDYALSASIFAAKEFIEGEGVDCGNYLRADGTYIIYGEAGRAKGAGIKTFPTNPANTDSIERYSGNVVQDGAGRILHLDKGMFVKNGRLYCKFQSGAIHDITYQLKRPITP